MMCINDILRQDNITVKDILKFWNLKYLYYVVPG